MKSILTLSLLVLCFLGYSQENSEIVKTKDSKFNISFAVGPSFRLAKIPSDMSPEEKKILKALKSGISYDFNLAYNINKNQGFGLKFNMYQSKASIGPVHFIEFNGEEGDGRISNNVKIYFIGPSYTTSTSINKDDFCANFAIGYSGYVGVSEGINSYTVKGSSLGLNVDVNYFFGLSDHFQIGPRIGLLQGVISEFEIKGSNGFHETRKLDKNNKEGLLRLDLSVAFRYKL